MTSISEFITQCATDKQRIVGVAAADHSHTLGGLIDRRVVEHMKVIDERVGFVPCQEPRPEACTMHYDPVCGDLEGGGRKTYSNACVACSDSAVMVYSEGACADHGGQETPK